MKRRARQPEPKMQVIDQLGHFADIAGAKVTENPTLVGGSVAFAVIMFFVSSNALFYQPFKHEDAFFATRSMDNYIAPEIEVPLSRVQPVGEPVSTDLAKTDGNLTKRPKDLQLMDIQQALAGLKLYDGTIDGVSGPKTRAAIEKFQLQAGLEPTGKIDPLLIDAIRTASIPPQKIPAPSQRNPQQDVDEDAAEAASATPDQSNGSGGLSDTEIRMLQAGLKAFGDNSIEVDGKIGSKTKTAIEEFQRLFQLEQTGEANRETLAKLQELGLISG